MQLDHMNNVLQINGNKVEMLVKGYKAMFWLGMKNWP